MADEDGDADGDPKRNLGTPTAPRPRRVPRIQRRFLVVGTVVAVAMVVGATVWWHGHRPERRLGPAPTVTGDACGLGHPPGAVVALDGETGALRWSRLVGDARGWRPTGLALADGTLAVSGESGIVQGLASRDGSSRWCARGKVVSSVDDRLFTVHDDEIVELDTGTGTTGTVAPEVLPRLLERAAGPIAVRTSTGGFPQQALIVTASDRVTNHDLWTRTLPGYATVTTDDLVILNDQTNGTFEMDEWGASEDDRYRVTAYDLTTGDEAWSVPLPPFGGLFLAEDRLYAKVWSDDTVRAIDAQTGRVLWKVELDNPGRTSTYSERGDLTAVAVDPASGDVFVLLVSEKPYRD